MSRPLLSSWVPLFLSHCTSSVSENTIDTTFRIYLESGYCHPPRPHSTQCKPNTIFLYLDYCLLLFFSICVLDLCSYNYFLQKSHSNLLKMSQISSKPFNGFLSLSGVKAKYKGLYSQPSTHPYFPILAPSPLTLLHHMAIETPLCSCLRVFLCTCSSFYPYNSLCDLLQVSINITFLVREDFHDYLN